MVENTPRSFCAHWATSSSCTGPPERRPRGLTDTSRREWRALRAAVRAADSFTELLGESTPEGAATDPRVGRFLAALSGDLTGSFPWLSYPDRGWEVPCPACGLAVFNERDAFVAHWTDNPDCDGPMTVPARVWRARGLSVTAADLGQPPEAERGEASDADADGSTPSGPTDSVGHTRPDAPAHPSGDGETDDGGGGDRSDGNGTGGDGDAEGGGDDDDDGDGDDWYGYNPYGNC